MECGSWAWNLPWQSGKSCRSNVSLLPWRVWAPGSPPARRLSAEEAPCWTIALGRRPSVPGERPSASPTPESYRGPLSCPKGRQFVSVSVSLNQSLSPKVSVCVSVCARAPGSGGPPARPGPRGLRSSVLSRGQPPPPTPHPRTTRERAGARTHTHAHTDARASLPAASTTAQPRPASPVLLAFPG